MQWKPLSCAKDTDVSHLLVLSWGSEATQCSLTHFPSKFESRDRPVRALRDSCTEEALGNASPAIWSLCTASDGHNVPRDSGATTLPLASFLSSVETQVPPHWILTHVAEIPPVQAPGYQGPPPELQTHPGYSKSQTQQRAWPHPTGHFLAPLQKTSGSQLRLDTPPSSGHKLFQTWRFPWVPAPCAAPLLSRRALSDIQLLFLMTLVSLQTH